MQRLLSVALENWYVFDGYAVGHGGTDLLDLPVDRFCNYVRWFLVRNMDDQQRARFEADLYRPPPGEEPAGPWTAEEETRALSELGKAFSGM